MIGITPGDAEIEAFGIHDALKSGKKSVQVYGNSTFSVCIKIDNFDKKALEKIQ